MQTVIAYFNLKTGRYYPNVAGSFELALAYSDMPGATLVPVADDVYRIRRANGKLTNVELRRVTLTNASAYSLIHFRNEDPVRL